jgi:hypothetical protein
VSDDLPNVAEAATLLESGQGVLVPVKEEHGPHARALLLLRVARMVDVLTAEYADLEVGLFIGDELEPEHRDVPMAFVLRLPLEEAEA